MSVTIALPSKGRLKEQAIAVFPSCIFSLHLK